jgi:hypothetical protein
MATLSGRSQVVQSGSLLLIADALAITPERRRGQHHCAFGGLAGHIPKGSTALEHADAGHHLVY